jgi:hypothetical protein
MARLVDLPVELLTQIMCECDDIKSVLKLSATCQQAQQVWYGNTLRITCTIFQFTISELVEFLALSKIEASTPPEEQVLLQTPLEQSVHLDHDIRRYLPWLERVASALQVICLGYIRDLFAYVSHSRNNIQDHRWRHMHVADYLSEALAFTVGWRDLVQRWLLLRRFAIGYHHPSMLADAYATLRRLTDQELNRLFRIAGVVHKCSLEGVQHLDIHPCEVEDCLDRSAGLGSSFAIHMVYYECNSRIDDGDPSNHQPGRIFYLDLIARR